MSSPNDKCTVRTGSARDIEYAVRANGSMPAKEFVESLEDSDQRKFGVLFDKLAAVGIISNTEQFKQVRGKIWEFKRHQARIGCFQVGRKWILTHGFIKKKDRWSNDEIEKANNVMAEHLHRLGL